MHTVTRRYNARIHMIDLREQEMLIEIDVEKSFVMKYVMNGCFQFNTIVNAMEYIEKATHALGTIFF